MARYRLVCTLGLGSILIQLVLWTLLTLVTLGLAAPFFAYYFVRLLLNHTEIHQVA